MERIKRFLRLCSGQVLEEKFGAVAVEYALIASLTAMAVIAAWARLEAYISNLY